MSFTVARIQSALPGGVLWQQTGRVLHSCKEMLDDEGLHKLPYTPAIVIDKSDHILSIYLPNHRIKSYHVELGDNGSGDKEVMGDHKTPEGAFYIVEKSILDPPDRFLGTRWMRLSYPNGEDAARGKAQGLIDERTYEAIISAIINRRTPPQQTLLGGGIGIHGGGTAAMGKDWTWGCVGLVNEDIEEFFDLIPTGAPVIIRR